MTSEPTDQANHDGDGAATGALTLAMIERAIEAARRARPIIPLVRIGDTDYYLFFDLDSWP